MAWRVPQPWFDVRRRPTTGRQVQEGAERGGLGVVAVPQQPPLHPRAAGNHLAGEQVAPFGGAPVAVDGDSRDLFGRLRLDDVRAQDPELRRRRLPALLGPQIAGGRLAEVVAQPADEGGRRQVHRPVGSALDGRLDRVFACGPGARERADRPGGVDGEVEPHQGRVAGHRFLLPFLFLLFFLLPDRNSPASCPSCRGSRARSSRSLSWNWGGALASTGSRY